MSDELPEFIELTQAEDKRVRARVKRRANKLCISEAKDYMACINSTFLVWNCSAVFKTYQDCFEKHATDEAFLKERLDFIDKKRKSFIQSKNAG